MILIVYTSTSKSEGVTYVLKEKRGENQKKYSQRMCCTCESKQNLTGRNLSISVL